MTTVASSGQHPQTRGHLDRQLSQLRRVRAEVYADMIDHRRRGDLENNDAYHRSGSGLQSLDAQIVRIHAALEILDEPDPGDNAVRVGSVVTVEFDHDPADRVHFLLGAYEQYELVAAEMCSPHSSLGLAILGSTVGDERTYMLVTGLVDSPSPSGRVLVVVVGRADDLRRRVCGALVNSGAVVEVIDPHRPGLRTPHTGHNGRATSTAPRTRTATPSRRMSSPSPTEMMTSRNRHCAAGNVDAASVSRPHDCSLPQPVPLRSRIAAAFSLSAIPADPTANKPAVHRSSISHARSPTKPKSTAHTSIRQPTYSSGTSTWVTRCALSPTGARSTITHQPQPPHHAPSNPQRSTAVQITSLAEVCPEAGSWPKRSTSPQSRDAEPQSAGPLRGLRMLQRHRQCDSSGCRGDLALDVPRIILPLQNQGSVLRVAARRQRVALLGPGSCSAGSSHGHDVTSRSLRMFH